MTTNGNTGAGSGTHTTAAAASTANTTGTASAAGASFNISASLTPPPPLVAPHSPQIQTPNAAMASVESLEAECNVLGMEVLNVLEFIGGSQLNHRQITSIVQKLSASMDTIVTGVTHLKHINQSDEEVEHLLKNRRVVAARLLEKLQKYQSISQS